MALTGPIGTQLAPVDAMNVVAAKGDRKPAPNEVRAIQALTGKVGSDDAVLYTTKIDGKELTLKLSDLTPETRQELGKLKQASEQFEAVLYKQMLAAMDHAASKDKFSGAMADMSKDMFRESMSEELSRTNPQGAGTVMFKQLSHQILNAEIYRLAQAGATEKKETL
ncbi:MAG: hypothetical protein JST40_05615 [Armatimonadetes bacterium]|nr:hypothetical protein [Armatimonadota bacterium]